MKQVIATSLLALVLAGCKKAEPPAKPVVLNDDVTSVPAPSNALYRRGTIYTLQHGDLKYTLTLEDFADRNLPDTLLYNVEQGDKKCVPGSSVETRMAGLPVLFKHMLSEHTEKEFDAYIVCYPELDNRLPGIAANDPEWAKLYQAKAKQSRVYRYLASEMNRFNAYPELNAALNGTGYKAQVDEGSLEKLMTRRVAQLTDVQKQGVPAGYSETQELPVSVGMAYLFVKQ